jgi:exosortase family protein XrtF
LKQYFIRYKPFLFFLSKFFLTYIVLTLIYQGYLNSVTDGKVDTITKVVANNTKQVLELFGQDVAIEENVSEASIKLFYHKKYVARMIEGCNAISVIVLFISFVVSFSGKLKQTLLFIFGGTLIIYVLNVIRIAALCVSLYFFPQQESILHGVLFPLFIYGVVFILWVIWVNKFSLYAKNTVRT